MKYQITYAVLLVTMLLPLNNVTFAQTSEPQIVIKDNATAVTRVELEYMLKYWPQQMLQAAANDEVLRLSLIDSNVIINKKIAELAKQTLTAELSPDEYWRGQLAVQNIYAKLLKDKYVSELTLPDMTELAEQRYTAFKDKYALIPESRKASYISIQCQQSTGCDLESKRRDVEKLLAELRDGADFTEYVAKYSDDPISKANSGKIDEWFGASANQVNKNVLKGLFSINGIGDYSSVVHANDTLYIIRLDEIKPSSYKNFDEVKETIVKELNESFRTNALKEYSHKFTLDEETVEIDHAVLDEIFASYKPKTEPTPE